MFFTQYEFLLFFLPVAWGVFRLLKNREAVVWWLLLCSAVFYASWQPLGLPLLFGSILLNYFLALRKWTSLGVVLNCLLLIAFKYKSGFAIPLGISFFTFVQISYLLEVARGEVMEPNLARYSLLVAFFPKITAGPIVLPSDFLAQLKNPTRRNSDLVEGLAMFLMGFAKKVLCADVIAIWAAPVFAAAQHREIVGLLTAWGGVLAYTLQIYYDFSGYSDMAIGLGRMFGFKLPINFNSPYKAVSMIDFWRRWHISLTRWLTENVFFSLPGNRTSVARRHLNLVITMLICGLWHGAGWTFAIWGGLHGCLLVINHLWKRSLPALGRFLTMLAVIAGWAIFGAADWIAARDLLMGMAGFQGIGSFDARGGIAIVLLMAIAMVGPNSQELLAQTRTGLLAFWSYAMSRNRYWWVPGLVTLWIFGVLMLLARRTEANPFIYAVF